MNGRAVARAGPGAAVVAGAGWALLAQDELNLTAFETGLRELGPQTVSLMEVSHER